MARRLRCTAAAFAVGGGNGSFSCAQTVFLAGSVPATRYAVTASSMHGVLSAYDAVWPSPSMTSTRVLPSVLAIDSPPANGVAGSCVVSTTSVVGALDGLANGPWNRPLASGRSAPQSSSL